MKNPPLRARTHAAAATKRATLAAIPMTVAALAVTAFAAPASATPGNAFDYSHYPSSATVSQTCSAADLVTNSVTVGDWSGTDLFSAPDLAAGQTITWTFSNTNAACTHDVASLVLYAAEHPYWDSTDQTSVRSSSTAVTNVGSTSTVRLTVPAAFTGPYQVDAVFGQPLPVVGLDGSYFAASARTRGSDSRSMLVSGTNGAIGAPTTFPDLVTTRGRFDYAAYSTSTARGGCDVGSGIQDGTTGEGFTVNGTYYGNSPDFVLAAGDTVTYTYRTTSTGCDGATFSLALYRNPDGGNGLIDMLANQRLVAVDTKTGSLGAFTTLQLTVPSYFTGGYQLDAVVGPALPIIGDAGRTYGSVNALKTSNYNLMKPAA